MKLWSIPKYNYRNTMPSKALKVRTGLGKNESESIERQRARISRNLGPTSGTMGMGRIMVLNSSGAVPHTCGTDLFPVLEVGQHYPPAVLNSQSK